MDHIADEQARVSSVNMVSQNHNAKVALHVAQVDKSKGADKTAADDHVIAVASDAKEMEKEVKCAHYEYGYVDSEDADCKAVCQTLTKGSFRIVCEQEAKVVNRCNEFEFNWATHKMDPVPKDSLCTEDHNKVFACKTCTRFLRDNSRDFLHDNLQSGIESPAYKHSVSIGALSLFAFLI